MDKKTLIQFKILKNKKPSYVTITVLILMLVLIAITYTFADAILSDLVIARNNKNSQICFYLAEAGVQDAIYKIKTDPTARNYFLAGSPDYSFSSPPTALISQGSYEVFIDNVAPGVATINSTGKYAMGLRLAQRKVIQIIAQATESQYPNDDAIYTYSALGESTGDIELTGVNLKIYDGGLSSGRSLSITNNSILNIEGNVSYGTDTQANLKLTNSVVNFNCYIDEDPDPLENPPGLCSSEYAKHIPVQYPPGKMPMISFVAYKERASSLNQFFKDQKEFDEYFFPGGTTSATANGVVYVEKSFEISNGRSFTMNGVLASDASISIGKDNDNGRLTINNPGAGQPSGVITVSDFNINKQGNFSGTGLVYIGQKVNIQGKVSSTTIELVGGILSRRVTVTDRDLIMRFDSSVISDTLGNPFDTPIIEINHWEEEY